MEAYNELLHCFNDFTIKQSSMYHSGRVDNPNGFSFGIQWNRFESYIDKGYAIGYEQSKFDKATKWSDFLKVN